MYHGRKDKMNIAKHLRTIYLLAFTLIAGCFIAYPTQPVYASDQLNIERDIELGTRAAEQIDKEEKFIEDSAAVERVQRIGNTLAQVALVKEVPASYGTSTPPPFEYSFKIIDDDAVNAFALPGGFVYVNQGLLDFAHSDDELAAVIAHEIAHVSHRHAMQLIKEQQRNMLGTAAAVLLGVLLGSRSDDASVLVWASEILSVARMSQYGQRAEFDADRTAVAYLSATDYNPVGMLTLLERLEQNERFRPQISLGIFATHPPTHLRAREIIDELEKRDIPINRRMVTNYVRVEVKPVEGKNASSVWIGNTELVRLADTGDENSAVRAQRIAQNLGGLLLAGAEYRDVRLSDDGTQVTVMGELVMAPTSEDAALADICITEVAASAANAIRRALINERLMQGR